MNKAILDHLGSASGVPNLPALLSQHLSSSELNSLLLEVFQQKTAQIMPADLLRAYQQNRFVRPAEVGALGFAEWSLDWLRAARAAGFEPLELSPVAPLGTCSVVGTVSQHKVVSALRGTEIVADATNVLALESALRRREQGFPKEALRFSVVHRHVRAQEVPKVPGFSAHFSILGLTSAGRDTGSFEFEQKNLWQHIRFYRSFLEENLHLRSVCIRLKSLAADGEANRMLYAVQSFLEKTEPDWPLEIIESSQREQPYYHRVQFKIVVPLPDGQEIEIADGGFTDWTQRLTGNRKERFLISGIGLELLYKMLINRP